MAKTKKNQCGKDQKVKSASDSFERIEKIPSSYTNSLSSPAEFTPNRPTDLTPLHNLFPNCANQLPEMDAGQDVGQDAGQASCQDAGSSERLTDDHGRTSGKNWKAKILFCLKTR